MPYTFVVVLLTYYSMSLSFLMCKMGMIIAPFSFPKRVASGHAVPGEACVNGREQPGPHDLRYFCTRSAALLFPTGLHAFCGQGLSVPSPDYFLA